MATLSSRCCNAALVWLVLGFSGCGDAAADERTSPLTTPQANTGPGPVSLARAYPDLIASVDRSHVILRDGTRFPISDGIDGKTLAERLDQPDIDDMFVDRYVAGAPRSPPGRDEDPGRVRYEPLFVRLYGDCRRGEVERRLRNVSWMPNRGGAPVRVTASNGVAVRLEAVMRDLERLPPAMTRYLVPSAGTYNCRAIAGTDRLSMHAYGAAIDIATSHADYWRWAGGEGARYRNRIPWEIVGIFERHGFIWGGKWSHFDTMHFEFRPELLQQR